MGRGRPGCSERAEPRVKQLLPGVDRLILPRHHSFWPLASVTKGLERTILKPQNVASEGGSGLSAVASRQTNQLHRGSFTIRMINHGSTHSPSRANPAQHRKCRAGFACGGTCASPGVSNTLSSDVRSAPSCSAVKAEMEPLHASRYNSSA
jgi:hypothetical protein